PHCSRASGANRPAKAPSAPPRPRSPSSHQRPLRCASVSRRVETVATMALTSITSAEVAAATRAVSCPRSASTRVMIGTVTKPPPKPKSTVVSPTRQPMSTSPRNSTRPFQPTAIRQAIDTLSHSFETSPLGSSRAHSSHRCRRLPPLGGAAGRDPVSARYGAALSPPPASAAALRLDGSHARRDPGGVVDGADPPGGAHPRRDRPPRAVPRCHDLEPLHRTGQRPLVAGAVHGRHGHLAAA